MWNRRHRGFHPSQPADLRRAHGAAAPWTGRGGHHDRARRRAVPAQGRGSRARRVPATAHAAAEGQHRHRPRALSDGRLRQLRRSAAVLRQCAVWPVPGAQRQPHQRAAARGRADARRPPSPQYLVGFGGAAQRARERAAALRHDARLGRRHLRRHQRHVPPHPGRLCRHRDDPRSRRDRLPRSARHPPAGHRQARHAARPRAHDCVGERRARPERFRADARRGAGRGRLHRRDRPPAHETVRRPGPPHAVHLRVRVLRQARLDHRQHLGVQGAPAHGRAARATRSAARARTTTSTS